MIQHCPEVSRALFEEICHHGGAGTIDLIDHKTLAKWRATYPDWQGTAWAVTEPGACFGPVNVIDAPDQPSAPTLRR